MHFIKRGPALFLLGLLVGAFALLVIRYTTYSPVRVHYHANFAVFINGQREYFKSPRYYQEVAICSAKQGIHLPQQRAHMHDNVNSLIHIHDHAVTWGQFFENLGWIVGPNYVQKDDGTMYMTTNETKLHILLNNQDYTDLTPITNSVINDKDRLLISYGAVDNNTLQQEYNTIPRSAEQYDATKDPASCSGVEKITPSERLHHLF